MTSVETSTCEIETPGPEMENVEIVVPLVCPDEEPPILTPASSAELITTDVISFVKTDTNAPIETVTSDIESPGPEIENVEVVCPGVPW